MSDVTFGGYPVPPELEEPIRRMVAADAPVLWLGPPIDLVQVFEHTKRRRLFTVREFGVACDRLIDAELAD